ncbi:TRAP transporter large permease [Aureimonas fodinaquatilis]|uniref:TRAP transporter large permease protein n=1 Tax=Aureimonas fodinaquatilis TaxID=2565783 RepID=A0A5B0DVB1_9HYPH|nr:TRAP transporter large permease [Aureimonas fodinaquatilis]KAA0970333.1 TRAP transporter large permease [Aureimonas fodinaquatilis]
MDFLASIDPIILGSLGLVLVVVLIMLGIPIALSIFAVGFFGQAIFFDLERAAGQLYHAFAGKGMDLLLGSIPLFVFMGQLISKSRIGQDLYDCVYRWTGHMPGGIAITGVVSGAGFGAVTGVSGAAVATMATITMPEMERYRYDLRLGAGAIASSSALAILIPPSLLMILYGIATDSSIGDLFIAGIFPAILLTISYALYIVVVAKISPERAPRGPSFSWEERFKSLVGLLPIVVIFTLLMGGIYSGAFTPSEAAGVGSVVVLLYLMVTRRLTLRTLFEATTDSIRLTAMVFLIFVSVTLLSSFLVLTGVLDAFISLASDTDVPAIFIILFFVLLYLILGMILDGIGMMLLTLPVTFPIVMALGYDPIWFGIIVTILVEVGLVTPPVGLNCYILRQVYPKVSLKDIFIGVIPFFLITMIWVFVFVFFPESITWVLGR